MAVKKKKTVDKFKKKKWFTLVAPKSFDKKPLGETPAEKSKILIGRIVKKTVDELTGQRKQRHITANFKVTEIRELNALTEIVGFEINNSYLRRMIRRRISKIETVVTGTTKDGKTLRVKAVAVSARHIEKTKEKSIRKIMTDELLSEIAKKTLEQLLQEMIFGLTSIELMKKAKEVSMLKRLEITKARVMEGK